MDRSRIERQLKFAQENLAAFEKTLKSKKVEEAKWSLDPKWRELQGDCRKVKRRLNAVSAVEERETAAGQAKTDKAAAEAGDE